MKNFDSVAFLFPVSSPAFKLLNIIFNLAKIKRENVEINVVTCHAP